MKLSKGTPQENQVAGEDATSATGMGTTAIGSGHVTSASSKPQKQGMGFGFRYIFDKFQNQGMGFGFRYIFDKLHYQGMGFG